MYRKRAPDGLFLGSYSKTLRECSETLCRWPAVTPGKHSSSHVKAHSHLSVGED